MSLPLRMLQKGTMRSAWSFSTLFREGGFFAVIGAAATLTHVAVALAVSEVLDLAPLSANTVGYVSAVGVSYFGNARLTFRRPAGDGSQFVRFVVASLLGFGLSQSIVFVLAVCAGWPLWMAMGPVVVLVPALSFLLAKVWAFRRSGAE